MFWNWLVKLAWNLTEVLWHDIKKVLHAQTHGGTNLSIEIKETQFSQTLDQFMSIYLGEFFFYLQFFSPKMWKILSLFSLSTQSFLCFYYRSGTSVDDCLTLVIYSTSGSLQLFLTCSCVFCVSRGFCVCSMFSLCCFLFSVIATFLLFSIFLWVGL